MWVFSSDSCVLGFQNLVMWIYSFDEDRFISLLSTTLIVNSLSPCDSAYLKHLTCLKIVFSWKFINVFQKTNRSNIYGRTETVHTLKVCSYFDGIYLFKWYWNFKYIYIVTLIIGRGIAELSEMSIQFAIVPTVQIMRHSSLKFPSC